MTWTTSKGNQSANSYPRTLSWIAVSFGGLALFLALGCLILISNPAGSTVRGYFYSVDRSDRLDVSILSSNNPISDLPLDDNVSDSQVATIQSSHSLPSSDNSFQETVNVTETTEPNDRVTVVPGVSTGPSTDENSEVSDESDPRVPLSSGTTVVPRVTVVPGFSTGSSNLLDTEKVEDPSKSDPVLSSDLLFGDQVKDVTLSSNTSGNNSQSSDTMGTKDMGDNTPPSSPSKDDSGCDLYQGTWVHDPSGPLYTNNTCPVLTQMQNCQGNGRPDKDYENWRWKPEKCDLPRFDPHKFLELMSGKTIAFIGDSVARNQMESLLCILWQVEVPKNRGNKKMQRYYFKSTSTMVVRIWSSWLVKHTNEPVDFAPGVVKLHLDAPDETIMEHFLNFDVIVLSSGHWFAKQSVYLLDNEPVGGQLWWPDPNKSPTIKMTVNNIEAFGISVETILTALNTHPNYTGLTIVRSFSPDHYEGGAWNTGGSCTGKAKPLSLGEVIENGFTNAMHEKQMAGFDKAAANRSRTKMMDITRVFEYRHDGHPGPYRSLDPNKLTKRGPDGKPPPQDCLHWCMPGPVDTWNEFVLEIIRRAHEEDVSNSPL